MTDLLAAGPVGMACEMGVLRALELAGKRGITRSARSRIKTDTPPHEYHTRVCLAVTEDDCTPLLADAWEHLAIVLPDCERIVTAMDWYVRRLIVSAQPYRRADLYQVLAVACEQT